MLELLENKVKLPKDEEIKKIINKVLQDTELIHPYSRPFEVVSLSELKTLAIDIKINSQKVKIVKTIDINDGNIKILDGKNRYIACLLTGARAIFETKPNLSEIEKVLEIISLNLNRRHYTLARRMKIAHDYYNLLKKLIIQEEKKKALAQDKKSQKVKKLPPAIQKKVNAVREKEIINKIAKATKSKPITVKQSNEILERAKTEPMMKKLWDDVEKGSKSVQKAYNEATQAENTKPIIKKGSQKKINTALRNELKNLISENKELQEKLSKIKEIIESDVSKNRMKAKILKIINDGIEKIELLPPLDEFSTIKVLNSKTH